MDEAVPSSLEWDRRYPPLRITQTRAGRIDRHASCKMARLPMDDLPDSARSNYRYRLIERTTHSFTRKVSIMGVLFVVLLLAMFFTLFGWRWTLALVPVLMVGALAIKAASLIGRSAVTGHDRRDIGETVYGFAGHELRAFTDRTGQVWIRAHDIRRALDLDRSDGWMARAYPSGFRRVNPQLPAYYIQPEAVRRHWRGSHQMTVNRFLSWMERELVPLQHKRNAIEPYAHPPEKLAQTGSSSGTRQPVRWRAMLLAIPRYGRAHWRGEHGLMQSAFLGGGIACLVGALAFYEPNPTNLVHHYRAIAIFWIILLSILGLTALWWGVGVWRSALRWIEAERSIPAGIGLAIAGAVAVMFFVGKAVENDRRFTMLELATMAANLDPKPRVSLMPDRKRLQFEGEMGYGSTLLVERMLSEHPGIEGIELNSPGGRAAEGFALARLVRDLGLNTYVRADCASACVLVFAGGRERLVGEQARFGLHRSGVVWRAADEGLSETDLEMREFLLGQGVAPAFVEKGLKPTIFEMWGPSVEDVLGSGLGTRSWN